jgi:hypothetical protein
MVSADEGRDVLTCWFLEKLSVNFYAGSVWRWKEALGGRRSQSYPQGIPRSCGLAARDRTHDIQHSPRRTRVLDAMTRGDEDWRGVGNQGCGTFAWQALRRESSGFRPHRGRAEPSDMNRTGVLTVTEREASPQRVNPFERFVAMRDATACRGRACFSHDCLVTIVRAPD